LWAVRFEAFMRVTMKTTFCGMWCCPSVTFHRTVTFDL
jgi:hypothetical protein